MVLQIKVCSTSQTTYFKLILSTDNTDPYLHFKLCKDREIWTYPSTSPHSW